MEERRFGYRSLFWPIVLIGLGVIWLLSNLGVIPVTSLYTLLRLWPLILIVIGLDLLIGRRSRLIGGLIGLAAVALVIFLLVAAPNLGLPSGGEVKTERFSEPVGQAQSAAVLLDLSAEPTTIRSLGDSDQLIDADIRHTGRIDFSVSGDRDKRVTLTRTGTGFDWWVPGQELHWDIGLTGRIPLDLTIDGGSGSIEAGLEGLQLSGLNVDVGSGSFSAALPASADGYAVDFEGGSGSADISLPGDANISMRLDTGSGSVNLDIPPDAAVRVDVQDSGSGSLNLPSGLEQVRDGDNDEGTWESAGYAQAAEKIDIVIVDLGSGSVSIR